MKRFIPLFFFVLSGYFCAFSQDSLNIVQYNIFQELQQAGPDNARINIHADTAITSLVHQHIALNEKQRSFSGYRIQIFSGNSSDASIGKVQSIKKDFEQEFPDIPAYLKYFDPDFKIRVGNYRSRLDCIPALYRIRKKYPASYPVKTDITLNELYWTPAVQEVTEPTNQ